MPSFSNQRDATQAKKRRQCPLQISVREVTGSTRKEICYQRGKEYPEAQLSSTCMSLTTARCTMVFLPLPKQFDVISLQAAYLVTSYRTSAVVAADRVRLCGAHRLLVK